MESLVSKLLCEFQIQVHLKISRRQNMLTKDKDNSYSGIMSKILMSEYFLPTIKILFVFD